jgi:hypothetical protein
VAPIRGQSSATVTKVATTSSGADWKMSEKGEREMDKGYAWIWREASSAESSIIMSIAWRVDSLERWAMAGECSLRTG